MTPDQLEVTRNEELESFYKGPIVGITGFVHGAGTSTIVKELTEALGGICHQHAGEEWRQKAVEWAQEQTEYQGRKLNPHDSQILMAYENWLHEPENEEELKKVNLQIDKLVGSKAIEGGQQEGGCIVEGKAAVPLLRQEKFLNKLCGANPKPHVFTVLVSCDPKVAARRDRLRDMELKPEMTQQTLEEIKTDLRKRREDLKTRMERNMQTWGKLYGKDYGFDPKKIASYYDIVIDTTTYTKDEMPKVVAMIMQCLAKDPRFRHLLTDDQKERITAYCQKHKVWL